MSVKEKTKKFWNENKTVIVCGAISTILLVEAYLFGKTNERAKINNGLNRAFAADPELETKLLEGLKKARELNAKWDEVK